MLVLGRFLIAFYRWGSTNYLKATESLQGSSLVFTTKFLEIPGAHLINLRSMKGRVDLGAAQ